MDSRQLSQSSATPLRALVEIIAGELKVYPIAESDLDEQRIIDALRFVREDLGRRARMNRSAAGASIPIFLLTPMHGLIRLRD